MSAKRSSCSQVGFVLVLVRMSLGFHSVQRPRWSYADIYAARGIPCGFCGKVVWGVYIARVCRGQAVRDPCDQRPGAHLFGWAPLRKIAKVIAGLGRPVTT